MRACNRSEITGLAGDLKAGALLEGMKISGSLKNQGEQVDQLAGLDRLLCRLFLK